MVGCLGVPTAEQLYLPGESEPGSGVQGKRSRMFKENQERVLATDHYNFQNRLLLPIVGEVMKKSGLNKMGDGKYRRLARALLVRWGKEYVHYMFYTDETSLHRSNALALVCDEEGLSLARSALHRGFWMKFREMGYG